MLNNPFCIEISRGRYGYYSPVELIPIYLEENGQYIPSGNFKLYAGYLPDNNRFEDAQALREQYFDNLELMGDDNPCFLGELYFEGLAFFEWRYLGGRLSENEVWQIIDLLQKSRRTYIPRLRR